MSPEPPPEPPPKTKSYTPARISIEDHERIGRFYRDLLNENPIIKASIIAAGIGAVLESLHIFWLAARFLLGR